MSETVNDRDARKEHRTCCTCDACLRYDAWLRRVMGYWMPLVVKVAPE